MITFKKFGETVRIRNDDWKKLRERFDAGKAKWDEFWKRYRINVSCSVCNKYNCPRCPFYVFKFEDTTIPGCTQLLGKLFKPLYFKPDRHAVCWSRQANKLARKQLGQILKMMDKIEASQ